MNYISREEYDKLNERERRLILAQYALEIGYGGVTQMSKRYNASRNTINKGIRELQAGETYTSGDRIRTKGAGRATLVEKYPGLEKDILEIAAESCFMKEGSDMKQLGTSCRKIAAQLEGKYQKRFSAWTIEGILRRNGYECPRSKTEKAEASESDQQTQ